MISSTILFCFVFVAIGSGCACPQQACSPVYCTPPPSCGVYQVRLDHCGPSPCPAPPVNCAPACAPALHKPVVCLPACIPSPKVVGASASCVKTVLKPQLYQQLVSVPIISRYLQTLTKPVAETITFNAVPVCPQPCSYPPPCSCLPPPPCTPCALPAYTCPSPSPIYYEPPADTYAAFQPTYSSPCSQASSYY